MLSARVTGNAVKEVLSPGRGQTQAAAALAGNRRRVGQFPYQWMFPGPNSKYVREYGQLLIPAAPSVDNVVTTYLVPEGLIFSLRGLVIDSTSPDWTQGDPNGLLFSLRVVEGVGVRRVEGFEDIRTVIGSRQLPFPIGGRLEFQSNTQLQILMTLGTQPTPDQGYAFGWIIGHTYPNAEAGDA